MNIDFLFDDIPSEPGNNIFFLLKASYRSLYRHCTGIIPRIFSGDRATYVINLSLNYQVSKRWTDNKSCDTEQASPLSH